MFEKMVRTRLNSRELNATTFIDKRGHIIK